jgi:hypothetical protein
MDNQLMWIVALMGIGTLAACFWKMKGGFGPFNLRVIGIVLISILATLLAIAKEVSLNAAMGILGATAGYLFGYSGKEKPPVSSANIQGSQFGDEARIAGRDINETINNLQAEVAKLHGNVTNHIQKVEQKLSTFSETNDYLFNTIYEKGGSRMIQSIEKVITSWENEGWSLKDISLDYREIDGVVLLFTRPTKSGKRRFFYYHGSNMNEEYHDDNKLI